MYCFSRSIPVSLSCVEVNEDVGSQNSIIYFKDCKSEHLLW